MIFQILHIRKTVKELRNNPGNFAGEQARDVIIGIIIIPAIIIILGLAFLFILAFTSLLGGPYLFFKIIFFLGLFVSAILGFITYKLASMLERNTKKIVNKTKEYIVK